MIRVDVQQGSAEWADLRLGIPTASQFHRIITPRTMKPSASADGYRNELLAEWVLGYPVVDAESGFMTRGTDMEERARAWYELQTDNEVDAGGFLLTDDERAGCSPDGRIRDEGLLEIKIPKIDKHIGFLLDGVGDDYRPQAQGQLLISGRQWVDLVVYNPTLPSVLVRVLRDADFIAKLRPALTQFCEMLDAGKRDLAARGVRAVKAVPPQRGLELVA